MAMTPMPHLPLHLISPQVTFFVCLFPQMKIALKGKRFADVEEVKQKTAEALKGTPTDKFKHCLEPWTKHLYRCVASAGEYFEGD